jgi:hypothetical protein
MRVTDDQTPSPCRRIARRFADGGPRQAAQRGSRLRRDGQPVVAPFSKCVSGHLHANRQLAALQTVTTGGVRVR